MSNKQASALWFSGARSNGLAAAYAALLGQDCLDCSTCRKVESLAVPSSAGGCSVAVRQTAACVELLQRNCCAGDCRCAIAKAVTAA